MLDFIGKLYKICVVILTILIVFIFYIVGLEKPEELSYFIFGEYPTGGNYNIVFYENESDYSATVTYKRVIYEKDIIDMDNLMIYPDFIKGYAFSINKDDIYSDEKIKELLLSMGVATIIDEGKASNEEIAAQNEAKNEKKGYWSIGINDDDIEEEKKGKKNDDFYIHELINWLKSYYKSIIYIIVKAVLGVLGIGVIVGGVVKFYRRNNVDIVFWGEIASGKTTILKRLAHPEITKTELLRITTTKASSTIKSSRIAVGKRDIYPYLRDNSGQAYAEMFDSINKKMFDNPYKMLIVTVALNPCKSTEKEIDKKYLASEISKAIQIISIVSESKKMKVINKSIIFINKCDLVYESEQEMVEDKYEKVKSILKEAYDYQMIQDLRDRHKEKIYILYGSALEGWGIYSINKIIENVSKE